MTAPRLRFAPSPTGHLHVGNARTALFNWLLATGSGGTLILRIEDTDVERSTIESERSILEDLRWMGLHWLEGPDVGGPYGPYRQSERLPRYTEAAQRLIREGHAYYCFCAASMLEADRAAALAAGLPPKYSGRCRALDRDASLRRVSGGEAASIRFAVPDTPRDVVFDDLVRGEVRVHTSIIGDPVIVRSNGRPQFIFAVVIDDAAMGITHVVRGEDHISNTSRQLLIAEALGVRPPQFAHVSLVLGPDHAPLSKRHGATSVAEFRARGYLPEALVNYLALLGWSPGDDQEIMSLEDMARRFDARHVSHSAAVFDLAKLSWLNRHYMKVAEPSRVAALARPYFERAGYVTAPTRAAQAFIEQVLPLAVGSVDRLEEIPERIAFLFEWDASQAAGLTRAEADGAKAVAAFADVVDGPLLDRDAFRSAAAKVRERTGLKGKALFHPLRVALTGLESGPELDLAVPAIDRAAALPDGSGVSRVASCAARARAVVAACEGA
ncbi:MAG: glutamate--tRNA ligase [Acidobacteriota bacterium]